MENNDQQDIQRNNDARFLQQLNEKKQQMMVMGKSLGIHTDAAVKEAQRQIDQLSSGKKVTKSGEED